MNERKLTSQNFCDAHGLDPAQLKKLEGLINDGSVSLMEDRWQPGRLMFFSGAVVAPLSSARDQTQGRG